MIPRLLFAVILRCFARVFLLMPFADTLFRGAISYVMFMLDAAAMMHEAAPCLRIRCCYAY